MLYEVQLQLHITYIFSQIDAILSSKLKMKNRVLKDDDHSRYIAVQR